MAQDMEFGLVMEMVGLDDMVHYFEGLEREARIMLDALLVEAGWYLHRMASLREGHGGRMPYDTGTLQASLSYDAKVKRSGNMSYVVVTTNVEYAPYQEYGFRSVGGRDIPGKGFMRYGARMAKEFLQGELHRRVRDLLGG